MTAPEKKVLIDELKTLVIESINLHHIKPDEISAELSFRDSLGLDSVDVLEIVVAVEQAYRLKVEDAEVGKKYFTSLSGIADFILLRRQSDLLDQQRT